MSSIDVVGDRVNVPASRSSPAGGAKTESNGALHSERRGEPDLYLPHEKKRLTHLLQLASEGTVRYFLFQERSETCH